MTKRALPFALYFALAAYYYSFAEYGLNIWDEGGFAYGALRTLQGQMALRDFNPDGYLPGRYLYGALFFKLFGIDLINLRLSVVLLTAGMPLMTYAAARRFMPPGFALLAALAVFSAPSMYYNRFYHFFYILLLYCTAGLIVIQSAARFHLLLGCIFLSAAFKLEVGVLGGAIGIACGITVYLQKKSGGGHAVSLAALCREHRTAGIIFAALGLGAMFYAYANEIPQKVFNLVLTAHSVWGNPLPDLLPFFALARELGWHQMAERLLFYLPLWTYAATGAILCRRFAAGRWEQRDLLPLAALLYGLAAFGLVLWRAGFDNLLRTLAPFYILFCYLLYLGWEKIRVHPFWQKGSGLAIRIKRVGLNIAVASLPFAFYCEMNLHHGFYAGSIGARFQETALLRTERMKIYTNPMEAKWVAETVAHIQQLSRENEPIFAAPLNPIFYYLTGRPNPTPYDWILPGMLNEERQQQAVAMLQAHRPRVIIYVDIPIDGHEERRFSRYAPVIYEFIVNHYQLTAWSGFFQILTPREATLDQPL